jgi:energy-coupling factor transporter ATP-binding protein EcfA2
MLLKTVRISRFRNFVDPQEIDIEDDVTALVGKNESGKTTILQALHRLKPANLQESRFDLVTEYPRWRLSNDRKADADIERNTLPVEAWLSLEDHDIEALDGVLGVKVPSESTCYVARTYAKNGPRVGLRCPVRAVIASAVADASIDPKDAKSLLTAANGEAAKAAAKDAARELKEQGESARAKALGGFPPALDRYAFLTGQGLSLEQRNALYARVPGFFYFSEYDLLPGEHDLNDLAAKSDAGTTLEPDEESVQALLSYANTTPADFLGSDYNARKAELQASALGLTRKVFEYWRQNQYLEVEFDTELEEVGRQPNGSPIMHRILKILMRDLRHGGISTNFETRSAGFRWFFSFLAAFSRFQESPDPIVVLLDEPGTSLHGEAQKDFLRFINNELATQKQVLYTTHSQYMVDPARYEKLRAVEDRSTRENPDLGVVVTDVDVSADPDTLLPIQAALGYSISQHLFLGAGWHLTVEGGSDFVYLQRLSEYLESQGRAGMDPRLSVIPLGSASHTPAFVALFAKHFEFSVLLDGDRHGKDAQRVLDQASKGMLSEHRIVTIGDVDGLAVAKPDIEDLFDPEDYLRLYNWAFDKHRTVHDLPNGSERILRRIEAVDAAFDHAFPAYALTDHRDEFFAGVKPSTLDRFEALFRLLNATLLPAAAGTANAAASA